MTPPGPTLTTTVAEHYLQFRSEDPSSALERFFERFPIHDHTQLLELLLMDQALEWRQGPGPGVEEYLRRFPAVANERQAVQELVYGEMRAAQALGLPLDVDAYLARFPDLAEALRRQLEVSAWLANPRGDGCLVASPRGQSSQTRR